MIVNEGGGGGKKLPTLTNPGAAGDMLSGKQLLNQEGEVVTGTIPSKTDADISVSGRTVTVPAGHYGTQASKSVATVTQATPSVTVSNTGLITAVAQQNAGYVEAGSKSATHQLTTQGGKTVTPGTSQQTAVASGRYTTGTVYVAGSSNLVPANIKQGVNIFGVNGTLAASEVADISVLQNRNDSGGRVIICYVDEYGDPIYNSYSKTEFPTTIRCQAPGIIAITVHPSDERDSCLTDDASPLKEDGFCRSGTYSLVYGVPAGTTSNTIYFEVRAL